MISIFNFKKITTFRSSIQLLLCVTLDSAESYKNKANLKKNNTKFLFTSLMVLGYFWPKEFYLQYACLQVLIAIKIIY